MLSNPARFAVLGIVIAFAYPAAATAQTRGAAEVALNRGINAFMSDDYDAARRQFEAALTDDPDFAAAHYFLGLTLLQTAAQTTSESAKRTILERAVAEFNQSRLRDPQLVLAYLDGAVAETILGRFESAESGFQQFIRERPNDPLPYLFLAVVYYRQAKTDAARLPKASENLDKAEAALSHASRPDRNLEAHIKLYRALISLQQNNREAARQALKEGYEAAPESSIGRQNKELLEKVESGQAPTARRPWDLTLRTGWDWDSNVILRGKHLFKRLGEEEQDDWRFGLGSAFTYRVVETDRFLLGAGLNTFDTWHTRLDEFNVQTYGANVYGGWSPPGADWLTLGLRYDWDYTFVGNESYLTRHRLTPQIDVREAPWTSSTVFYQYDARNYHNQPADRRLDRDGDTHALGVIQNFELFKMFDRPFTANASYRFDNVQTDGSEFGSENHIFGLGIGVPLPWDLTFNVANEWETDFYRHGSQFDADHGRRRDFIYTVIFALTKRFNEHLSTRFQVDIVNDDSNVSDLFGQNYFSYSRVIYGLSVTYQF